MHADQNIRGRIVGLLRGGNILSAGTLAFLLKADIDEVRMELRTLISRGEAKRTHNDNGTLTYSLGAPAAPAPKSTTNADLPMHMDAHVDVAISEIEIISQHRDSTLRKQALESIGAVLAMHLEAVSAEVEVVDAVRESTR